MENEQYAIFNKENKQVIYKQILISEEINQLNAELEESIFASNTETGLATGYRLFVDINIREQYPLVCDRLFVVLKDYFPDIELCPYGRFYSHKYGGIKPHTDKSHDGRSNYTLLLYLTDDFDDGKLHIKMKRSQNELNILLPDKLHKVFTFTPMCGYGVIFNKDLLHWASDIYIGNKNFLLIHFYSTW